MAKVTALQEFGNLIKVLFDDGTSQLAYPTPLARNWVVAPAGSVTPPESPLIDYAFDDWGISFEGDWEWHSSYSRGGTDYPMGMNTPIKAPASGTLVNYGNTDAAGLKSILIFDTPVARVTPASSTLMNGVYRETDAGAAPAASYVIQHLNSQVAEGHYNQGEVIGYSGNTAGSSTGQIHLHAHLLAGTTIDDRRMDIRKFVS